MRVVDSRVVYENRWMRVHEDRTLRDDGTPGLYGWVEKPPSALIVPIEDGQRVADRAVPPPGGAAVLGVPAGRVGGASTSSPEDLARGELAEETGLRAASMELLGRLHFAYGLTDQFVDVWRATGLEPGPQALEETEAGLVVGRFSVADVERMVRENEIRDAASVAAWHLATR